METYSDPNGNSGIKNFEISGDFIIIGYKTGKFYKYSYSSAGLDNVEEMKRLARKGDGLNSFIALNKPKYESRY